MKTTTENELTIYISSSLENVKKGVKLIVENLKSLEFLSLGYPDNSSYTIYIETVEEGILSLKDYKILLRENGIKNASFFWSFLEKVRREVKKSGDKNTIKTVFNILSFEDKVKIQKLYYSLSSKLSDIIWDSADNYETKHPEFYLSEDGMMDLIPYLMTLGEKRVNTFFNKPHLALNISQKEWEYPFNLCDVFLYFDSNKNNTL